MEDNMQKLSLSSKYNNLNYYISEEATVEDMFEVFIRLLVGVGYHSESIKHTISDIYDEYKEEGYHKENECDWDNDFINHGEEPIDIDTD